LLSELTQPKQLKATTKTAAVLFIFSYALIMLKLYP
jgi:hypothetical protein